MTIDHLGIQNLNSMSSSWSIYVEENQHCLGDGEELYRLLEQPALMADISTLLRCCLTISASDCAPHHILSLPLRVTELGVNC